MRVTGAAHLPLCDIHRSPLSSSSAAAPAASLFYFILEPSSFLYILFFCQFFFFLKGEECLYGFPSAARRSRGIERGGVSSSLHLFDGPMLFVQLQLCRATQPKLELYCCIHAKVFKPINILDALLLFFLFC